MEVEYAKRRHLLNIEWDERRNGMQYSETFPNSNKLRFWQCREYSHVWQASPGSRLANGNNCPVCANRVVLAGFNDVRTRRPELLGEWVSPKSPQDVCIRSTTKVPWKCGTCTGVWETSPAARDDGYGCPYCSGQKVLPGFNDFRTKYPETAREWSSRNRIRPSEVSASSGMKFWWLCSTCSHEWQATPRHRGRGKTGCGVCAKVSALENKVSGYLDSLDVPHVRRTRPLVDERGRRMELDLIVPGRFAVEVQDEATHSRTSDYEPMTFRGVLGNKKGPRYSRKKEALCESQLGLP